MDEIAPIKIFAIAAELVKFGFYIASSLQKKFAQDKCRGARRSLTLN